MQGQVSRALGVLAHVSWALGVLAHRTQWSHCAAAEAPLSP
jgi:hypothetical protein